MKTKNQMKPLARFIAASLAVGTMAGFGAQALAQTAAGTLIKNLATVSYEDENGNSYSAQSNEAVVTVAPVYSATIENDNTLSGSPGQTVYFPHTLSNTGNIEDTYTVGATETSAVPVGAIPVVYLDANNNGQPDSGEAVVTSVTVPAGEQVNLVVAFQVPTNATAGTVLSTELTATSTNLTTAGSVVTDSGTNSDGTDGTNDDIINVSTGPVLVLNKSSVHDEATNTITYTLTVKNNGASDAANVNIIDPLPKADTDGDGVADTQLNFVSVSVNGLLTANGDTVPTTVGSINETGPLGDINSDGVTETLDAIIAKDLTLPSNTTVSVVYEASYLPSWTAGSDIDNTFVAFDDPDNDGDPADSSTSALIPSNTTNDVIPQTYGVDALDTGTGSSPGVNDGGDDDAVADTQYVDVAPTGADVLFQHIITNNGNGDDTFNLDIANNPATDGFPAGTTFTFWDSTGTVQLTDSDNDGIPDTGVLGTGESETIMVKAKLPAGSADAPSGPPANGYNATLTATSSEDPTATPAFNETTLKLGSILQASVDIANVTADQGLTGFNDTGAINAQDEAPVVLATGSVNSTVTFDLQLANESGNADSFLLGSNNVPAGWDVVFKDAATGNVITTTTLVPGNGVFAYTAEVTIPNDTAQALSNSDQAGAVDGIDTSDDGNTNLDPATQDGDLDYQMNFTATSTSSPGVTDSVTNAVDITVDREVVITPNGQNQVQPGGTVVYTHQLENNGNQPESVEMAPNNTQPGWTTVINVDTTGDGVPDSILNAPATGTTTIIKGVDENGNVVDIEVTDADGDGIPELNLEPGENLPMTTTVTAPSTAALGSVDSATITVTDADPTSSTVGDTLTSSEDQTTVMLGQVRLDKTAAIDEGCDGALETPFVEIQTTQVKPGDCVVWNLTATNDGTATVKNVKVSDAAPVFTDYVLESMKFCQGNGCTLLPVDDASNGNQGTYSGGLIQFFAINGASDPANGIGGELVSGEKMTGQFTVKIQ